MSAVVDRPTELQSLAIRAAAYHADYSEDFKASIVQAIASNNGNVNGTAKLFNLPRDTVNYWWRNSDRYVQVKQPVGNSLADKLENIANETADSMLDHDLSLVTLRDKAAVLSVAVDKMQLLRGLPTSITDSTSSVELTVILADALSEAIDITPVTDACNNSTDAP